VPDFVFDAKPSKQRGSYRGVVTLSHVHPFEGIFSEPELQVRRTLLPQTRAHKSYAQCNTTALIMCQVLISGVEGEWDLEDLRQNVIFEGGYSSKSGTVCAFCCVLRQPPFGFEASIDWNDAVFLRCASRALVYACVQIRRLFSILKRATPKDRQMFLRFVTRFVAMCVCVICWSSLAYSVAVNV